MTTVKRVCDPEMLLVRHGPVENRLPAVGQLVIGHPVRLELGRAGVRIDAGEVRTGGRYDRGRER